MQLGDLDNSAIGVKICDKHCYLEDFQPTPCGAVHAANGILLRAQNFLQYRSRIDWGSQPHHKQMTFDGKPIAITHLTDMYAHVFVIREAKIQTLLHGFKIPSFVNVHTTSDASNSTKAGYSFLTDSDNKYLSLDGRLIKHLSTYGFYNQFENGQKVFEHKLLDKWLNNVASLVNNLMVAIHLSTSQPACSTKASSLLFRNCTDAARNLFIQDGQFMIITAYSKTSDQFQKDKVVVRYLSSELSQLLLVYLVLIHPCKIYFMLELLKEN
ncbi:hypothetical protein LPJ59_001739 [Coemansia sp. RSA 2399]|nr:hypothetical protein LPJ59_001739 [Coemansia sp. RSA 2399]KAJ1906166.1 hypothetical protein LPJ81_001499 [Coemansia sp. IMI 209127]